MMINNINTNSNSNSNYISSWSQPQAVLLNLLAEDVDLTVIGVTDGQVLTL